MTVRQASARLVPVALLVAAALPAATQARHGGDTDHLPPVQSHVQRVSEIGLTGPIGDLVVHAGHAYVTAGRLDCDDSAVHVVDVSDPGDPSQRAPLGLLPEHRPVGAPGAITVGARDLLAVGVLDCASATTDSGGFDLYDVSDPSAPRALVQGAGADLLRAVTMWRNGGNVYLAGADAQRSDSVEIYDITDADSPVLVEEYGLPGAAAEDAYGRAQPVQDLSVEQVDGSTTLLVAWGDAGVLRLDVDDPAAPVLVGDSDFGTSDPLTGFDPPEGNARHAEFTADDRAVVSGDEDLEPFRPEALHVASGATHQVNRIEGANPAATLDDGVMNGPTAYGGYGCGDSLPIPTPAAAGMPAKEPGEEWIVVLQRGPETTHDPDDSYPACPPGEKAFNADAKGWDAVLIVNRHHGTQAADAAECGFGGFSTEVVAVCSTHAAFHDIFDSTPQYGTPYDDDVEGASMGERGEKITIDESFDGWGGVHLYDADPDENDKLPARDAFAVPEALNPDYALGFGDLSFAKLATDPTEPVAYVAWRSAGLRVLGTDGQFAELGAFIPDGGADYVGVEQFTNGGERFVAVSDRDFGLLVLRHTGLGRAARPACADVDVSVASQRAVDVPLSCTDANGNPLTLNIASGPSAGTLGAIDQANDSVTYTNSGNAGGTDSFTFAANDGAASSAPATATIAISASPPPVTGAPPPPPPGVPPGVPPVGLPADLVPPRISSLRLRPRAFRRGRGARVGASLSEAAVLRMTVQRVVAGRRSGGRCRRPSRSNRRGRRCTRLAAQPGQVTRTVSAGAVTFRLAGRIGGRTLSRGRYRLVMVATDVAGNRSAPARATFRVVR